MRSPFARLQCWAVNHCPAHSGPKGDKENASATSASYAADASSNDESSKSVGPHQGDKTSPRPVTKGRLSSDVPGAATTSTDTSEVEDTYEDELDTLIEEFRGWKNDMKDTIDDFKRQLSDLQGEFSRCATCPKLKCLLTCEIAIGPCVPSQQTSSPVDRLQAPVHAPSHFKGPSLYVLSQKCVQYKQNVQIQRACKCKPCD